MLFLKNGYEFLYYIINWLTINTKSAVLKQFIQNSKGRNFFIVNTALAVSWCDLVLNLLNTFLLSVTATCDSQVYNNITYFVNPDFPSLSHGMNKCSLKIKKIDPEISQFRLDFIHFHLVSVTRLIYESEATSE